MTIHSSEKVSVVVPVTNGRLCPHFGHCHQFAFYEVDMRQRRIESSRRLDPPEHEPGLLPAWLTSQGAHVVIAGGMGRRARDLFQEQGVEVIVGAPEDEPHDLVQAFLDRVLLLKANPCTSSVKKKCSHEHK